MQRKHQNALELGDSSAAYRNGWDAFLPFWIKKKHPTTYRLRCFLIRNKRAMVPGISYKYITLSLRLPYHRSNRKLSIRDVTF